MVRTFLKVFLILPALVAGPFVLAQTCTVGINEPGVLNNSPLYGWPLYAVVSVYIDTTPKGFTAQQVNDIKAAFISWQATGASRTNFLYTSTPPAPAQHYSYTITRQTPIGGSTNRASTGGTLVLQPGGAYSVGRNSAYTYLDPGLNVDSAITQAMVHEIGHSMGLDDCGSCSANTTAMKSPSGASVNDTGLPNQPYVCDVKQANSISGNPCP